MAQLKPNDQAPGADAGARAAAIPEPRVSARCALLTPPGAGAIAAIRVCGPAAWDRVQSCLRGRDGKPPIHIDDGKLWFGQFCDEADALDDVIVAVRTLAVSGFVVDISCHGGVRIVERILLTLARRGVAVAQGEVLSDAAAFGASAIERDIDAILPRCSTTRGARYMIRQRALLSEELNRIADCIDAGRDGQARAAMHALLDRGQTARLFCDPPSIALIGPVNAGKSSLANRMAGREHAVVSDRAGTTRDWVTIDGALDGIPVTLVDTPGRATDPDDLEREAIARAERLTREARLRVLVLDAARMDSVNPDDWFNLPDQPVAITVINKVDQVAPPAAAVESLAARSHVVLASALTGENVAAVRSAATRCLGFAEGFDNQPAAIGPMVQAGLAAVLAHAAPLQAATAADIRRFAVTRGA